MKTTTKLPSGTFGPPITLDDPHITLGQLRGFANSRGCDVIITLVKAKNSAKLIEAAAAEEARQRAALVKDRDPRHFPHPGDVVELNTTPPTRLLVTRSEGKVVTYLASGAKHATTLGRVRGWRPLVRGARVIRVVSHRGEIQAVVQAANTVPAQIGDQPVPRLRWPGFQPMVGDIMQHLDNKEQREVKELAKITYRLWYQIIRKGKPWGSARYVKMDSWREWCKRAKVVRRAEEIGLPKIKKKK